LTFYLFPVPIRSSQLAVGALLCITGCGGEQAGQALGEFAALNPFTASTTLLRLPAEGGVPILYRSHTLTDIPWKRAPDSFPALRRPIGTDLDQRLVFALDRTKQIVGLDLETGKVRAFVEDVADAFLSPDGTLFAVGTDSTVTQLHRRTAVRWSQKMAGSPRVLFGTLQHDVIALTQGEPPVLNIMRADLEPAVLDVPSGPAVATAWGDLLAIAAETALVVYEPKADPALRSIDIPGTAQAVAFSPSGHRIYVSGESKRLLEVDRDGEKVRRRITLPGPPQALRSSLYGGWLLARPASLDSVWVVDLTSGKLRGAVAGAWSGDLPTVIGDVLLLRQGDDVVAFDLKTDLMPEVSRIAHGALDFYLPLPWIPEETGTVLATEGDEADGAAEAAAIYLQVSSSQNPEWAQDFATRLSAAGLAASVLSPRPDEEAYRVVIGPYRTREEADSVGRELGAPYFIYQPRTQ
jgi:hypothetical protein